MILNHAQEYGLHQIKEAQTEYVIGIDEVGVGACAGPLVVCGAVFAKDWRDPEVKDSKLYLGGGIKAHRKRSEVLNKNITPAVRYFTLEAVSHRDIDAIGMGHALEDAMRRVALQCTYAFPDSAVVIDGDNKPFLQRACVVVAIPKGDGLVPAVSAASVIAKTTRDALMIANDGIYPGYDFGQHMGYPTEGHIEAIKRLGLCPIHRRSYKIIKNLMGVP